MYRSIFFIGLCLIVYGTVGTFVPHNTLSLTFLLPDGIPALIAILLGSLLCNFAVVGYLRKHFYKVLFGVMGSLLCLVGVLGIVEPTYFGYLSYTVRPADLYVAVQSGIGLLIAGLEYERPAFYIEIGVPYRQYFRYLISRPTLLLHGFKKRTALVAANFGIIQPG